MRNVGLILVSTDKGLCGGLNTNTSARCWPAFRQWQSASQKVQATAIGNKGLGFLQRLGANVVSQVVQLGDAPHLDS